MIMPILIKKGDKRILLNNIPPKVDCRVVAEETFQELLFIYIQYRKRELKEIDKELKEKNDIRYFK